ncbi:hypothetical protein SCB17_003277 [Clostridium perfringens]|nr:hypothetical protein [Clostridium perfringens]
MARLKFLRVIIKSEMYQMYKITNKVSLRYSIKNYIRFHRGHRPQNRYDCKTHAEVKVEASNSENSIIHTISKNKRIKKYK